MNTQKRFAVASFLAVSVFSAGSAFAECNPFGGGGFLGNVAKCVTPPEVHPIITNIDRTVGPSVATAANGAVIAAVPGAAPVIAGAEIIRNMPLPPAPGGFSAPGPAYPSANAGNFQPPAVGNVCVTPVGYFPGPVNPIGAPCMAHTPYGVVYGRVG